MKSSLNKWKVSQSSYFISKIEFIDKKIEEIKKFWRNQTLWKIEVPSHIVFVTIRLVTLTTLIGSLDVKRKQYLSPIVYLKERQCLSPIVWKTMLVTDCLKGNTCQEHYQIEKCFGCFLKPRNMLYSIWKKLNSNIIFSLHILIQRISISIRKSTCKYSDPKNDPIKYMMFVIFYTYQSTSHQTHNPPHVRSFAEPPQL